MDAGMIWMGGGGGGGGGGLNFGHLKFPWKYLILFQTSPSLNPLPPTPGVGVMGGGVQIFVIWNFPENIWSSFRPVPPPTAYPGVGGGSPNFGHLKFPFGGGG